MSKSDDTPVVLAISGNDPSGGAGIAADIETIAAHGCHCAPVITTLTVQDTRDARRVEPLDPALVVEQAEAVLADLEVKAIKLGLLGSVPVAQAVAALIARHAVIPVILDPVLVAGGGARLADRSITEVMLDELTPRATIVTPNSDEARELAPDAATLEDAARTLIGRGARFVLLKGAHEDGDPVVNTLFARDADPVRFEWPRLDGVYHGSGCTLASAIAAGIARGRGVADAAADAQRYVHRALTAALRIGHGQPIPRRFH